MIVSSTYVKIAFATFVGKIAQLQEYEIDDFIVIKCIKLLIEADLDNQ